MDYIWERTGVFPDIREIAELDLDAIDDLMKWDIVKAYLRTQQKQRTG